MRTLLIALAMVATFAIAAASSMSDTDSATCPQACGGGCTTTCK